MVKMGEMMHAPFVLIASLLATSFVHASDFAVRADSEMRRLLKTIDSDHDDRITILDKNKTYWLEGTDGQRREVSGTYFQSNLLQELKLAVDLKRSSVSSERIFEDPVERISRSIRELYWDGLTRRVDPEHLAQAIVDSKLPPSSWRYVYVPVRDDRAFDLFSKAASAKPKLKVKVQRLPEDPKDLIGKHGLLVLALDENGKGVPFVAPGGRFNEMYGWDSYFEALGLLADGRRDLARAMVDNFVFQIENYGKILNANRTYYLNRSQPPFLTSMISDLAEGESKEWLKHSLLAAIREYFQVWMGPERLTATGLSRYFGSGHGVPIEVEKGHFDAILNPAAKRLKLKAQTLLERYNSGKLADAELDDFFAQDRAVRESGHDTTYRWRVDGKDRAADFVTVDLNSLLYKTELDIARLIETHFKNGFDYDGRKLTAAEWRGRAQARKTKMVELMWDADRKIFFDFNFKINERSKYIAATAYFPFWASGSNAEDQILPKDLAAASFDVLSRELEMPGGLSATAESSLKAFGDLKHQRQWEYPNGWPPHQMIAWVALENYGLKPDRLVYRWLHTLTKNAVNFNGTLPEKTDVVARSHAVFAEYGNIGTDFSYITKEGFGWMNASYQVGLKKLSPELKKKLSDLRPPEWIF